MTTNDYDRGFDAAVDHCRAASKAGQLRLALQATKPTHYVLGVDPDAWDEGWREGLEYVNDCETESHQSSYGEDQRR